MRRHAKEGEKPKASKSLGRAKGRKRPDAIKLGGMDSLEKRQKTVNED